MAQKNSALIETNGLDYYTILHERKPIIGLKAQFLGPFQTFLDVKKDLTNTFKPYKSSYYLKKDAMQPLYGVTNLLKGLVYIVAAPLTLLFNLFIREPYRTIKSFISLSSALTHYFHNTKINVLRTMSWLLDGSLNVIRGVTQIATTPLTWLIKIPMRELITTIKGAPTIEENNAVKNLVSKANAILANPTLIESDYSMDAIKHALHCKFIKSSERGQHSNIRGDEEKNKLGNEYCFGTFDTAMIYYTKTYGSSTVLNPLSPTDQAHAKEYIALFSPSPS